jgi:thiol-disulfide isomerase/thioredoxin
MNTTKLLFLSGLLFLMGAKAIEPVKTFVKGSMAEIQASYQTEPHIIVFWGQDCAYCMKELAMMGELLPHYPSVNLITVNTDSFLEPAFIQQKLGEFKLEHNPAWGFASDYPETLYFDVDKRWRGELPYTILVDNKGNRIKKHGLIKQADMHDWLARQ